MLSFHLISKKIEILSSSSSSSIELSNACTQLRDFQYENLHNFLAYTHFHNAMNSLDTYNVIFFFLYKLYKEGIFVCGTLLFFLYVFLLYERKKMSCDLWE